MNKLVISVRNGAGCGWTRPADMSEIHQLTMPSGASSALHCVGHREAHDSSQLHWTNTAVDEPACGACCGPSSPLVMLLEKRARCSPEFAVILYNPTLCACLLILHDLPLSLNVSLSVSPHLCAARATRSFSITVAKHAMDAPRRIIRCGALVRAKHS